MALNIWIPGKDFSNLTAKGTTIEIALQTGGWIALDVRSLSKPVEECNFAQLKKDDKVKVNVTVPQLIVGIDYMWQLLPNQATKVSDQYNAIKTMIGTALSFDTSSVMLLNEVAIDQSYLEREVNKLVKAIHDLEMLDLHGSFTSNQQSRAERTPIFVYNRCKEINEGRSYYELRHVKGEDSPADWVTRPGHNVIELQDSNFWRHGPTWLPKKEDWPPSECIVERTPQQLYITPTNEIEESIFLHKNWTRLETIAKTVCYAIYIWKKKTKEKFKPMSKQDKKKFNEEIVEVDLYEVDQEKLLFIKVCRCADKCPSKFNQIMFSYQLSSLLN